VSFLDLYLEVSFSFFSIRRLAVIYLSSNLKECRYCSPINRRLILISDFLIFLMPKNDLRTEIKSNKPIISSENGIEKWHLRQSAKTVAIFKSGRVRYTACFCSWIEVAGSSQQLSRPCLDQLKKYAKILIYQSFHID